MPPLRVIQIGLGPIGQRMIRQIHEHPLLQLVGAIDNDPHKLGHDAGKVAGLDQSIGVKILASLDDLPPNHGAQVASVMTSSSLLKTSPLLFELCRKKLPGVSTCEELAYPWQTHPQLAAQLDEAARHADIALLGTGVNPGFLMDIFPLVITGVCRSVESIRVERYQDAARRRVPFQEKIGAGLTVAEFEKRVAEGRIRHVGLTESMNMLAARLNWKLTRTEDRISPLISHEELAGDHVTVPAGCVKGVHQVGEGYVGDKQVINLIFHAAIQQPKPQDRIIIRGEPSIESVIPGGVHGDLATCSIAANAIPVILRARPGLRTMADLEVVTCFQG
ncbi:MAG: NAD(P)H-dependent amine dehydrogenase family protein [Phycisphaerales bacterium]